METTETDPLAALTAIEQASSKEQAVAMAIYWTAVQQIADDKPLTETQVDTLRANLRMIDRPAAEVRRDVEKLRELRALAAADADADPVAAARGRHAEAQRQAQEAHAAVAEAKAALAAAEEASAAAGWAASSAADGVNAATQRRRRTVQRAAEILALLAGRGMPPESAPPIPSEPEKPKPTIPHRVLQRAFVNDRLVEPGAVVLLAERVLSPVLRPIAEGEDPAEPLTWRVRALRNHRDRDHLRLAGDVFKTTMDPAGHPFLAAVGDDVPLGLGTGGGPDDESPDEPDGEQQDEQEPQTEETT